MEETARTEDCSRATAALRSFLALLGEYRGPVALVIVLVLGVFVAGKTPDGRPLFLTGVTHVNVLFEYAEYGILAAGMTLVILTAGIDLSVGSVLGLSAVLFALLTLGCGLPSHWAALGAIGAGGVCGLASGLLVSRARFQPFVATLAMMVIARGLAKQVCGHMKVAPAAAPWYAVKNFREMPPAYEWVTGPLAPTRPPLWTWYIPLAIVAAALFLRYTRLGRDWEAKLLGPTRSGAIGRRSVVIFAAWVTVIGLPAALLAPHLQVASYMFLAVILAMALVVKFTRFGRHLYAIGGNEEAARLSGIPVTRSKTLAYVLCGLLSGLAGIISACRLSMGDPEAGATFELDAIAAVVIGGTSLMGGRGAVSLTLVGALLMGYANKILSNVKIATVVRGGVYGGVFTVALVALVPAWRHVRRFAGRVWDQADDPRRQLRFGLAAAALVAIPIAAALASGSLSPWILDRVEIKDGFLQDGAKLLAKGLIIVLAVVVQETRRRRA